VILVLVAGNRLFSPPAGYFAAAVLAGSPLYVLTGQFNTLDMGVTFFLSAAMIAFALGRMYVFWAACALAVLSKGLIGIVLPLGTIALYVLLKRDWALLARMKILPGAALFLLIATPWFIAVSAANDEFLRFFFYQEHFQRFTTHMHHRDKPLWYFIPVLAGGIAPFIFPLAMGWGQAIWKKTWSVPGFDARLFFALWALVVFVFFSLSGSKLPAYIAPMFPALALLAGAWLAGAHAPRRVMLAQSLLMLLVGVVAAVVAPGFGKSYPGFAPWLVAAGFIAAAAGFFAMRPEMHKAVLLLALSGFASCQVALVGHATQAPIYSAAGLIASVQPPIPREAHVYTVDAYDHTIPWYLRRTVTMVSYKDELGAAVQWEPGKFVPDLASFARLWRDEQGAYAFVAARDIDRMRAELPMQIIARDPRYVIVRKP
jgi:hypothetical protein